MLPPWPSTLGIAPRRNPCCQRRTIARRGAFHCRPGAGTGAVLLTGIGNAKLLPGVIGPLCAMCYTVNAAVAPALRAGVEACIVRLKRG